MTKHASKVSSANDLTARSSDDDTDPHHPWTMYHPESTDCSSDNGDKVPQRKEKRCSKHPNPAGIAAKPKKTPMQRFRSPWSREVTRRGEPEDMNTDCSSDDNSFSIYHNSWDMFHTDEHEGRTNCGSSDAEESALYKVPGGQGLKKRASGRSRRVARAAQNNDTKDDAAQQPAVEAKPFDPNSAPQELNNMIAQLDSKLVAQGKAELITGDIKSCGSRAPLVDSRPTAGSLCRMRIARNSRV